jgi:hypothetical protein
MRDYHVNGAFVGVDGPGCNSSPLGGSTMTFTGTPSRSLTVGGIPMTQHAVAKVSSVFIVSFG